MRTKIVSAAVSVDDWKALREAAFREGVTLSTMIERILGQHLKAQKETASFFESGGQDVAHSAQQTI